MAVTKEIALRELAAELRAENERLRSRLDQIYVVCCDNDIDTADHRLALRFARDVADPNSGVHPHLGADGAGVPADDG